ncbi:MAG: response regulator transcription factor [Rhodothermales bacterium]|nr:response regulator transcription factor [Rhodothermales bacterium]
MPDQRPLLRCLVVDDDAVIREQLSAYVEAHDRLTLAGTCSSAIEADNWLRSSECDVLFVDVEMPMMTGLELVRHLDQRPSVVMVTGKAEYAVEAFDVEVSDYLLKPVSYARFAKAVQRVDRVEASEVASEPEHLFVKSEGRLVKLDLSKLTHVEAQRDYMMFHENDRKLLVHGTMKAMTEKLPATFARVHRSFLVRIDAIEDVEDGSLVIGREVIPIGASYRAALMERLRTL